MIPYTKGNLRPSQNGKMFIKVNREIKDRKAKARVGFGL